MSVCACGVNLYDVKLCDVNLCDVNLCDVNLCDVKLCDVNLCDVNLCDVKLCDVNLCDVNLCGVNLCDVKLCDVNLCDFNLCDVNLCDVNLCDVKLCDVNLCDVNLCDVKLCDVSVRVCDVNRCGVCLCDVNLCDVNLCDFNLCDVNLCDVNLCDVKLCDVNLCDVNLCDVKLCDVSVRVCDVNLCGVCLCDVNLCNANLCAQLPQTQFTNSKAPNPHASKTSTQNFRTSYWHSYPKRNLHTARRQTRMPARHPHKIYPKRNLHTASRQTRMPGRHRRKIFAAPIGTATPNAIYTQHGAKPACQQDINSKFSQLLLAQLPRTQFTQSTPPNPHASKTSTQNFRTSYWHSYPERNLHTASRQTRMPGRHQHAKAAAERRSPKRAKAYIRPRASAPSPTPAAQKQRQSGGAQNAPKRTSDPVQVLQVPRLPRKSSGRAAEPKTRQSVHQTPCKCSKSHACHAKAAAERRSPKRAKAYIRPRASTPNPTPATQKLSSGRAAEPKTRQSVHQTPCKCSKSHACHAKAAAERRSPKRAKAYIRPRASAPSPTPATQKQRQSGGAQNAPKRTSDPVQVLQVPAEERRSPKRAKAYIRPRASAPSPTPAAQKQRQSGGAQNAPKRTSDPVQVLQVPRLPRKSSGRAAEPKTRQSVHQTPCKCSKSHACHAKAAAERRSPKRAKAYIRPRASAPSPTPATQKQRQSGGAQNAPKRTSDPVQVLQVPRLPRKSSGRAAEPKTRQSVHQAPCKCSKPHACHAKAAAERRSPKRAKAYIRPRASTPSPTPATQKLSSGRAAEPKTRQSVHQAPCKRSKSHACHAKAAAERRSPKRAKAYIRPRASAPSPTPATQKQRQSGGAQNAPKRTSDPLEVLQDPRLPRKSSGRAAEPKTRQSVHQTPLKRRKSHTCHAKRSGKGGVKLCDVKLCDVKLCDVNLRDVKLCEVNLRDVKLCDVNLCDVKLCDVKLCDVKLCDVKCQAV